jgi:hypothetical protein
VRVKARRTNSSECSDAHVSGSSGSGHGFAVPRGGIGQETGRVCRQMIQQWRQLRRSDEFGVLRFCYGLGGGLNIGGGVLRRLVAGSLLVQHRRLAMICCGSCRAADDRPGRTLPLPVELFEFILHVVVCTSCTTVADAPRQTDAVVTSIVGRRICLCLLHI